MIKKPLSPARPVIEPLENRALLSGTVGVIDPAMAPEHSAVVVAAKAVKNAATKTTLTASTGTLAADITFTATVRASAAAGSPAGTVNVLVKHQVIGTITLSPIASTDAKYAYSEGTFTLVQQPGGTPYYFGNHAVSATFIPAGAYAKSSVSSHFTVVKPTYTPLSDGASYETAVTGSGPAIQSGQTANVFYTGYLEKNGKIFDYSVKDGDTAFPFTLGAGDVIPGFDAGTLGMQVGETRVVLIPPAEGYGSTANGPIPANSTLIFVITLESIS